MIIIKEIKQQTEKKKTDQIWKQTSGTQENLNSARL
jgi:hypothetical protein